MKKITLLTCRVSIFANLTKSVRNFFRFLKYFIQRGTLDFDLLKYSGHIAVTKSIVTGMRELDANFNYNPISLANIGEVVVVLSDVEALRQAIELKKKGIIKKLLAGPNILELPTEHDGILADESIDLVLVPSEMTVEIYEKFNPNLKGRVRSWYAGVDEKYWKPSSEVKRNIDALVYWKNVPPAFCRETERILKKYGYQVKRVVYGHYSRRTFKRLLDKSAFAVFLSISETQGLALAEAWSMNVPTIVWDPGIEHYYIRNLKISSAPYLTKDTGARWKELGDLEKLLEEAGRNFNLFEPRRWLLGNMTYNISAEQLLELCD